VGGPDKRWYLVKDVEIRAEKVEKEREKKAAQKEKAKAKEKRDREKGKEKEKARKLKERYRGRSLRLPREICCHRHRGRRELSTIFAYLSQYVHLYFISYVFRPYLTWTDTQSN
jgi:hypothetical protein